MSSSSTHLLSTTCMPGLFSVPKIHSPYLHGSHSLVCRQDWRLGIQGPLSCPTWNKGIEDIWEVLASRMEGDQVYWALTDYLPTHPRVHSAGGQRHPAPQGHHHRDRCPPVPTHGCCLLAESGGRRRPAEEAGAGGHAGGRLLWQRHCPGGPEQ